ncbi:hypothetical protein N8989_01435 [Gammaproteobacteria bacterium]|nr:hypothetical protein [Gammaproteobacteria bacterium]
MDNFYSLDFILKLLKKRILFIFFITCIAGLSSAAYLYKTPDVFLSTSLVTISGQNNSLSRTSSLLKSFTGSSISSDPDVITNDIVVATAKSRKFILNFVEKFNLVPVLFDYQTNSINLEKNSQPKQYEIYSKFLDSHLSITENQANGYITFNLRHGSPEVAYEMLSNFIEELDSYFRQYKKNKAIEAIAFYENEFQNSTNKNLNLSLANLIEQNYQTLSFASMSNRFALIEIDPPNLPEMKIYPSRTVLTIVYTILALIITIVFTTVYGIYKTEKSEV